MTQKTPVPWGAHGCGLVTPRGSCWCWSFTKSCGRGNGGSPECTEEAGPEASVSGGSRGLGGGPGLMSSDAQPAGLGDVSQQGTRQGILTHPYTSVAQLQVPLCLSLLLQEGGPFPGPETGLLSNTRKWIVHGDMCADKAGDFIEKRCQGGEQEGREPRRTALPCGLQSWVLWWLDEFPGFHWPITLTQGPS